MHDRKIVRRNRVRRSNQGSAFSVDLKLEGQNQPQVKSTQVHPVGESAACDLTKRHQLTHMWRNTVPNFAKKGGGDMIRSIFTVSNAGQGRSLTHRQSSSFQDMLDLSCTSMPVAIGHCQRQTVFCWEPRVPRRRVNRTNRRYAGTHPSTWATSGRTGWGRKMRGQLHEPFAPWS